MKNILITQRSEYILSRNEYWDCLDQQFSVIFSDSFNLIPISNTTCKPQYFAESLQCDGIILSGGNTINKSVSDADSRRFKIEQSLLDYARSKLLPVVGICYGMQRLNVYCGGSLQKFSNHVTNTHNVFFDGVNVKVNSFHENCLLDSDLSSSFQALGRCSDGTIECILHQDLPWLGIMWHPERKMPEQNIWVDLLKKIFTEPKNISCENIKALIDKSLKN